MQPGAGRQPGGQQRCDDLLAHPRVRPAGVEDHRDAGGQQGAQVGHDAGLRDGPGERAGDGAVHVEQQADFRDAHALILAGRHGAGPPGDGWTGAQAYSEMKQYRFEGFPDHPVLRNYVYAYKTAPLPKQPAVLATGIVTTQ